MARTFMVRVSDKEHALLLRAKQELIRKGYDTLPEDLRPSPDEPIGFGTVVGVGSKLLVRWLERKAD